MQANQSSEAQTITRLYREWEELYHAIALQAGLSDSAFLIFYAITELGEGCLQKDIAQRYFISRQTVSSSIRVLKQKGYLFLKPGKRRDMHIFLTGPGREVLEGRLRPLLAVEEHALAQMPAGERQVFFHLFQKYLDLYRQKLNTLSSEAGHRNVPPGPQARLRRKR